MSSVVTGDEVADMVRHWLHTPVNRYYGSGYGSGMESLLQKPMTNLDADLLIQKMKADIPILAQIPNSVNVYQQEVFGRPDAKKIIIEVLGSVIDVTGDL